MRSSLAEKFLEQQPTFTAKIGTKGKSGDPIYLVHARDYTGYRAYYFLQVQRLRVPLFERIIKQNIIIELEDYGTVLLSGYGEVAPEHLNLMRESYGWEGEV